MEPSAARRLGQALVQQPDMVLVGEQGRRGVGLLLEVRTSNPHAVVLAVENGDLPGECSHLLGEFPDLKVIALVREDGSKLVCELRPQPVTEGPMTADSLFSAIRAAVNR